MNMPTTRPGLRFRPLVWALLLGCILTYPFSPAVSRPPGDKRDYILVINTYAESTPWSRGIIADITAHVEQIENLELYTEHMTLLLVDSPEDIRTFEANLLREYGKKPPQALVLIGTPAALLRNFINSIWQDIPTIVCAEQDFIGPDKYYLKRQPIPASEQVPLRALADQDNLTLLYSPAYLDQSVDLMKRILPGMDRLVFIDDARYVNRQTEHDLAELLGSKYPGMKYTVYSADKIGIDQLLDSLSTIDVKQTGVLFSSWHYLKNMSGRNEIMTNPFKVIASSSVPLFSLRPTGLKSSGMIGGYVYGENEYSDRLIATIDAVLEGKQPRDIPFYTPAGAQPVFNYPVLLRHNISPNACPTNTLFFDKPSSFMERYKTEIGVCGSIFLLFLIFQQWRIAVLRKVDAAHQKEMETQAKYSHLFNNMPILYMQERVVFDAQGTAIDTVYVDVNAHFERSFYPLDEVAGKSGSTVFPESMPQFMPIIDIVLKEKRSVLPLLPQAGEYFLRGRHLPLVPAGYGRHFLHRQHSPARCPEKGGFGEPETRTGARRSQHHPLEMGSHDPHHPVRPQQGGQDSLRDVAGKQPLACGGRGVLLLESPQGRPGTRPHGLPEPDRREYGEGLRRVPRRIQRKRTLAHGVGRGTGHGRNPRH